MSKDHRSARQLGMLIRAELEASGLSLRKFAQSWDIDPALLSRIMRHRARPTPGVLARLGYIAVKKVSYRYVPTPYAKEPA